jgi:hypothetical protein
MLNAAARAVRVGPCRNRIRFTALMNLNINKNQEAQSKNIHDFLSPLKRHDILLSICDYIDIDESVVICM